MSEDIACLNGLTTETISMLLEAFGCQFIGIIIAFFFSWKVALVATALSPFVIVGGVLMSRLQWKSGKVASAEKSGDK